MKTEISLDSIKELLKSKSAQIALAGVTLILVTVSIAYFTYPAEDQETGNLANIAQAGLQKPNKDNIDVDGVNNKTVEDTSRFKSRDLFQALVAPLQAGDDPTPTGSASISPSSAYNEYEGKSNPPVGGSNTPGGNTGGGNSPGTGTNTPPPAAPVSSVTWMRLESLSDTLAVVRFVKEGPDSSIQLYELEPGEKFEENYMVVGLSSDSAVIWKGDERIELKIGEAYYIQ